MTIFFNLRQKLFSQVKAVGRSLLMFGLAIGVGSGLLTGCALPQVSAQARLFSNLSLVFAGEVRLPKQDFEGVPVGGLSAITYDRQRDRLYALSDDRSNLGPARFYTLKLKWNPSKLEGQAIAQMQVEGVTTLKQTDGSPFPPNTLDPEGLALTPQSSVFISSEGFKQTQAPPFVMEFDLKSGVQKRSLPIPKRYLPKPATQDSPESGIRDNLGFEALTLSPGGTGSTLSIEPFRVFTATEAPLVQDLDPNSNPPFLPNRFLHYVIGDGPPLLVAEHVYPLDLPGQGELINGLPELLALDEQGQFLSLERSLGLQGFGAKIYQLAIANATDTRNLTSLKDTSNLQPIRKKLLLNLRDLGIRLDNLEGMTLGPRFPNGDRSLILVSDDNFKPNQVTQFLFFRLQTPQRTTVK